MPMGLFVGREAFWRQKERLWKRKSFPYLRALWGPKKLAIIHYLRHQKRKPRFEDNRADQAAQHAALEIRPLLPLTSLDLGVPIFPDYLKYSKGDIIWGRNLPISQHYDGWSRTIHYKPIGREGIGLCILQKICYSSHMGIQRIQDLLMSGCPLKRDYQEL